MTRRIERARPLLALITAAAVAMALVLVVGNGSAFAEHTNSVPWTEDTNHATWWESWGATEEGESDWTCVEYEDGTKEAFVVPSPPTGEYWRLAVVKAGSSTNELHWNPTAGDELVHSVTGDWSHVILCSRPNTSTTTSIGSSSSSSSASSSSTSDTSSSSSSSTSSSSTSSSTTSSSTTSSTTATTSSTTSSSTTSSSTTSSSTTSSTTATTQPGSTTSSSTSTSTSTTQPGATTTQIAGTSITNTTADVSATGDTLPFTGLGGGMYGLIAMALIGTGLFILTGVRALRRETDE